MIGDVKNLAALSPSGPAGSLNTDMQPAPFKYDFGKMKSTDILAEEQKVIPQLAQAQADLKRAEMQYEQNLAGEKAKATEKLASDVRDKVTETQKKEAEFPYPEFHPTQENAQSLGELFSLVSVVGLMLGSSGKMASMNALGAMNGMLQGWQKGRADLYKKEKDIFDKEFQRIKTIRESLRKDLMDYMSLVPYDKEAAMYKAEEIARKAGSSSIISAYMNKQQPEMALKILDSAGKVIQHKETIDARAKQEADKLDELRRHHKKVEAHQSTVEKKADYQYFVTNDNQVLYINKRNPNDKGIVADMEGNVRRLGAAPPVEKLPKKGETAAKFIGEVIGRKIDVAAAEKLTGGIDFMEKTDNLAKKNISLGNVPGLSVNLADKFNGLLKANIPVDASGQQILTQEAIDNAWQKAQESKDFASLSDKSKVMAKAELDTVMSYLQSKYGNRAPVAEFRAAQNVISRRSASPTAFSEVMKDEKKAAQDRLIAAGFTADDIAKVKKRYEQERVKMRSIESPSSTSNVPAGVDPDTWSHMTDEEKALWQN